MSVTIARAVTGLRTGICADCFAVTTRTATRGPHPKRCPDCLAARRRAGARASTAAYRERLPGRGKETYAKWYAANAVKERADSLEWYRANRERARETNRRWYKENADKSRAKARRRDAVKRGVASEKFLALEIFERDQWICQLCGGFVDQDIHHPDPMSASLDHRVPLAAAGPHTRANVQLAHLSCNISKGARMGDVA